MKISSLTCTGVPLCVVDVSERTITTGDDTASECVPLLEISRPLGLIEERNHGAFRDEIDAICKMLTRLARGAESMRRESKGEQ